MFAIAFTILVLDLQIPDGLSPEELRTALQEQWPQFFSAGLSFAVIGRFWLGHHEIFDDVRSADRSVLALNALLLVPIVLIPFSTSVLAEYGNEPIAVVIYSLTVGAAGAAELVVWLRVTRGTLVGDGPSGDAALRRTLGLAGVALAFFLAIPVALLTGTAWAGQLCWLIALVPAEPFATRWEARRR